MAWPEYRWCPPVAYELVSGENRSSQCALLAADGMWDGIARSGRVRMIGPVPDCVA